MQNSVFIYQYVNKKFDYCGFTHDYIGIHNELAMSIRWAFRVQEPNTRRQNSSCLF